MSNKRQAVLPTASSEKPNLSPNLSMTDERKKSPRQPVLSLKLLFFLYQSKLGTHLVINIQTNVVWVQFCITLRSSFSHRCWSSLSFIIPGLSNGCKVRVRISPQRIITPQGSGQAEIWSIVSWMSWCFLNIYGGIFTASRRQKGGGGDGSKGSEIDGWMDG